MAAENAALPSQEYIKYQNRKLYFFVLMQPRRLRKVNIYCGNFKEQNDARTHILWLIGMSLSFASAPPNH